MNILPQKKIAARILKCGISRVRIDPASSAKVKKALTRQDIRNLVKSGIIAKIPEKQKQPKEKGRKGIGSRKGSVAAKIGKKTLWLRMVRPQRRLLSEMKVSKQIEPRTYRKVYRIVKGGVFRNKQHMLSYLKEHGLTKEKEK